MTFVTCTIQVQPLNYVQRAFYLNDKRPQFNGGSTERGGILNLTGHKNG